MKKRKRKTLENWKTDHESDVQTLRQQLKESDEALQNEKKYNEKMKGELEDVKDKLVNTTMELMQLKDNQQGVINAFSVNSSNGSSPKSSGKKGSLNEKRSSSSDTTATNSPPETQVRSWNKKLIYDMQDVTRQLNNEKKARKELEQWKLENEEKKIEDMKKKSEKGSR